MRWISSLIRHISQLFLALGGRIISKTRVRVTVSGLERLPTTGPVMLVARHYHHFYDGCILLGLVPRRLHIFVALDWIQKPGMRRFMESACRLAEWPAVLRDERLTEQDTASTSVYLRKEARRYLLRAASLAVRVLRRGEMLVIFPEAYPTIDPAYTPKQAEKDFLPFRDGYMRLADIAERDRQTRVAIVPAGLAYTRVDGRWHITLRLGEPLYRDSATSTTALAQRIEEQVRSLSYPADASLSMSSPQQQH